MSIRDRLPPLLRQRAEEFNIPDIAFRTQAVLDRIYVWQVPLFNQERFGDGPIIKAQSTALREWEEAPRGVIVSAGLQALDTLACHGMALGHLVSFSVMAPYRIPLSENADRCLVLLRDGDLAGSEDLMEAIARGDVWAALDEHTHQHRLFNKDGPIWKGDAVIPVKDEEL